jgi:tRNA threonylcarbamoyladenosine biosynthesis protein TsaE
MISDERSVMVLLTKSPEETFRIGQVLADGLQAGDVVALTGELGSGKTCLTQGIASGLGVPEDYAVTSPTFTLINEYPGRQLALYHLDVYRLTGCADLPDMGYDEYLSGRGVMVIEWAEKIREAVPAGALFVYMTYVDECIRKIEISCCPDRIGFWKKTLKGEGFLKEC